MRVTAFIGSARKAHTYNAANKLLEKIKSYGDIEYEIVNLNEYNIKTCIGCKACLDNGEELCPLDDDRDIVIKKMSDSDGIIFASPNYSFQVSGFMKVFIDRLAFFLHRPAFFGKTYTNIVAEGVFGGNKIMKYLDFVGDGLGFNTVKGCCIKTLEPISKKQQKKNDKAIDKLSRRFYSQLVKKGHSTPSLLKVMLFRMTRTTIKAKLNEEYRDYNYFKENGWFETNYYYPVELNPIKKAVGNLSDKIAAQIIKKER